jgi:hypothetical protein
MENVHHLINQDEQTPANKNLFRESLEDRAEEKESRYKMMLNT